MSNLLILFFSSLVLQSVHPQPRNRFDCLFDLCEHAASYPEQKIKSVIQNTHDLHSFFGNVIEPFLPVEIENRFSGNDYQYLCQSIDMTVMPRRIKDVDNVERNIANVDGFRQVVKYQLCENGERCYAEKALGRRTRCVQKFHVIKLLTADMSNDTLEYRDFQVPTTCVCTYVVE